MRTNQTPDVIAMHASQDRPNERFLLWVDGVGGYLVCLGERVTIGQAGCSSDVDIPIQADISRCHARLRRDGEGYLLEAFRPAWVDGRPVEHVAVIGSDSRIRLGQSVRLRVRRPHALSGTIRVDLESRHRIDPTSDGVILLADTCVLGPRRHAHVVCRDWSREVLLYRHEEELFCRLAGEFTVDGVPARERAAISTSSRVVGDDFAFSLEPLRRAT